MVLWRRNDMQSIQALILAGGLGTRLRSMINDVPKPMAQLDGQPFLEYQIKFLQKYDICDVIISVGYKAETISDYFGDGTRFSSNIRYSKETSPLGTGGAIKKALPMLKDTFLVLNGDSIFLSSLTELLQTHEKNNADLTVLLRKQEDKENRYGKVLLANDDRIVGFQEKQSNDTHLINAGMYVIEKHSVMWDDLGDSFSFEKELLQPLIHKKRIYGHVSDGYFIDIGIPTDYKMAQNDIGIIRKYLELQV